MEKLMIAMPSLEMMPVMTCQSLVGLIKPPGTSVVFSMGSIVHAARNDLTDTALEHGAKYVLWLDSDMVWNPDLLMKLEAAMTESGADIVSAMCWRRKPPIELVQYSVLEPDDEHDGMWRIAALDKPPEGIEPISACGFGGVLMNTDILEAVKGVWGKPFDYMQGLGEDLSFCYRARMLGAKIVCDGRVRMGHLGTKIYGDLIAATDGEQTPQE